MNQVLSVPSPKTTQQISNLSASISQPLVGRGSTDAVRREGSTKGAT